MTIFHEKPPGLTASGQKPASKSRLRIARAEGSVQLSSTHDLYRLQADSEPQ